MKTFLRVLVAMVVTMSSGVTLWAADGLRILPPAASPQVWAVTELRLEGVPTAANPYDPDEIAVDATFVGPSGRKVTLPAFWYRPFTRALTGEPGKQSEALTPAGEPGWRVRWTPLEKGRHTCRVAVTQAGKPEARAEATLNAEAKDAKARGFVRAEPVGKRYFRTDDGTPLPLLGENLCWHGKRGTYDYDDWFGAFSRNGMNYTRFWMSHNAFGLEFFGKDRLNYNQQAAWKLDYVLEQAAEKGIYVMLCFDYHGIFQVDPDRWGTNNYWPQHAYNRATGGPCAEQREFFTNAEAKSLYRKRLRYLIARYGAQPSVMSWQFFNEINNVYRYLDRDAVLSWHDEMSRWIRERDPYRHLVTTSFGSAGEEAAMWKLPGMDYTLWHWYAPWGAPYTGSVEMAAAVTPRFQIEYGKPFYIGEFGTSSVGLGADVDPHWRGLQQALWAGVLSGGAGTAMPWWWEEVHKYDLYPLWGALHRFLEGTGIGSAKWRPASVHAPRESRELGEPIAGKAPFEAVLDLKQTPVKQPETPAVVRNEEDTGATRSGYVYGSSKPERKSPLRIELWTGEGARMVMHLNSVSEGAILAVRVNGKEIFRRVLPNKDGGYERNREYDEDIPVALPAGKLSVEIVNPGEDWFLLDNIRVTGALPARAPSPEGVPLTPLALTDGDNLLLWVVDPHYAWPRGARGEPETLSGGFVTLTNLRAGDYAVQWWDTRAGRPVGAPVTVRGTSDVLRLPVPPFRADIAARLTRAVKR